jgi:hypothetical protein
MSLIKTIQIIIDLNNKASITREEKEKPRYFPDFI